MHFPCLVRQELKKEETKQYRLGLFVGVFQANQNRPRRLAHSFNILWFLYRMWPRTHSRTHCLKNASTFECVVNELHLKR